VCVCSNVRHVDTSFAYFVARDGQVLSCVRSVITLRFNHAQLALSEPPNFHMSSKLFDFQRLMDDSQVQGRALSPAAMLGDEVRVCGGDVCACARLSQCAVQTFTITRPVSSVPARFITAGRITEVSVMRVHIVVV
jgi:hypothetical protein